MDPIPLSSSRASGASINSGPGFNSDFANSRDAPLPGREFQFSTDSGSGSGGFNFSDPETIFRDFLRTQSQRTVPSTVDNDAADRIRRAEELRQSVRASNPFPAFNYPPLSGRTPPPAAPPISRRTPPPADDRVRIRTRAPKTSAFRVTHSRTLADCSIHETISKNNMGGEDARKAELLADFGGKMRKANSLTLKKDAADVSLLPADLLP
jgi:hypothetical protein